MFNSVNNRILSLFLSIIGVPISNEFAPKVTNVRNRAIPKAIFDPSQDRCEETIKVMRDVKSFPKHGTEKGGIDVTSSDEIQDDILKALLAGSSDTFKEVLTTTYANNPLVSGLVAGATTYSNGQLEKSTNKDGVHTPKTASKDVIDLYNYGDNKKTAQRIRKLKELQNNDATKNQRSKISRSSIVTKILGSEPQIKLFDTVWELNIKYSLAFLILESDAVIITNTEESIRKLCDLIFFRPLPMLLNLVDEETEERYIKREGLLKMYSLVKTKDEPDQPNETVIDPNNITSVSLLIVRFSMTALMSERSNVFITHHFVKKSHYNFIELVDKGLKIYGEVIGESLPGFLEKPEEVVHIKLYNFLKNNRLFYNVDLNEDAKLKHMVNCDRVKRDFWYYSIDSIMQTGFSDLHEEIAEMMVVDFYKSGSGLNSSSGIFSDIDDDPNKIPTTGSNLPHKCKNVEVTLIKFIEKITPVDKYNSSPTYCRPLNILARKQIDHLKLNIEEGTLSIKNIPNSVIIYITIIFYLEAIFNKQITQEGSILEGDYQEDLRLVQERGELRSDEVLSDAYNDFKLSNIFRTDYEYKEMISDPGFREIIINIRSSIDRKRTVYHSIKNFYTIIKSYGINLELPSPRSMSFNDGRTIFALENITINERVTAERLEKTMNNVPGKTLLTHNNNESFNTWLKLPESLRTVFTGSISSLIFTGCSPAFNFFNLDVFQKQCISE